MELMGLPQEHMAQFLKWVSQLLHNRHFAFSFGPHFCAGSHLAKRELAIALEEWMARVPPFRIAAGEQPVTHGGQVFGVDRLVLEW